MTVAGIILAAAVAGIAWYGYPIWREHAETSAHVKAIQTTVDGFGDRLKTVESQAESWTGDQLSMRNQIQKLSGRFAGEIAAVHKQMGQSSAEILREAEARFREQIRGVDARVSRLESSDANENAQTEHMQQQLGQLRSEVNRQANELQAVRQEMHNDNGVATELANLKNSEERNHKDVESMENSLATRRIAFEARKNHVEDVAPGVSIKLTGMDPLFHRASGWIFLMPDRRTLWLHKQSTQEPVVFYGFRDGKKREVVLTKVTKNDATGYVLLPKDVASPALAAN